MIRSLLFAAAALALVGCTRMTVQLEPLTALKAPPASRWPRSGAVYLKRERHVDTFIGRREHHETVQVHDVLAILTTAGLKQAESEIRLDDNDTLVHFEARTISPNGTVHPVDPTQVFSSKNRVVDPRNEDSKDVEQRVFRYPNAEVGAILEVVYAIRSSDWSSTHLRRINNALPIEKYIARLTFNDKLRAEVNVYNDQARFAQHSGWEENVYTLELGPIPADEDNLAEPAWVYSDKWWASRIRGYDTGTTFHYLAQGWPFVFDNLAKKIYLSDGYSKGAKLELDAGSCAGDRRCVIEKALAVAREKAIFSDFTSERPRPLKEALERGRANSFEKALIVRQLLANAGITAHVALLVQGAAHVYDKFAPNHRLYDHQVVHLPAQEGLPETWIDPACEECAVGEIPSWDVGSQALVIEGIDHRFKAFETRTFAAEVTGRARLAGGYRTRSQVTFDPETGAASVEETVVRDGATALRHRIANRHKSERELRELTEKQLAEHFPGARLRTGSETCDRAAGHCTGKVAYDLPGHAALDGSKMVIPLTLFSPTTGWEDPPRPRQTEIWLRADFLVDDTIEVAIPAGFHVAELPEKSEKSAPSATTAFEARVDGEKVILHRTYRESHGQYARGELGPWWGVRGAFAATRRGVLVLAR